MHLWQAVETVGLECGRGSLEFPVSVKLKGKTPVAKALCWASDAHRYGADFTYGVQNSTALTSATRRGCDGGVLASSARVVNKSRNERNPRL